MFSSLFIFAILIVQKSNGLVNPELLYPQDFSKYLQDGSIFDFIVVGAGSAGAVVANRLSEIYHWKVLLIETGRYPTSLTEIPAFFPGLQDTAEDWKYKMEVSDTYGFSLKNKASRCPRGKALGGTSNINAMLYVRGNRKDYDGWVAEGNNGWNYDMVLKHFRSIENTKDVNITGFGKSGNLLLSRYTSSEPIRETLEQAYKELGYKTYTQDSPIGYMDSLLTVHNGTRTSTAKAFLQNVKHRKNLYVALNSQVTKLIIENSYVKGVRVSIGGKIQLNVYATKETILSAGSINSPQILMNSGIGPENHLHKIGIDVIKNLPVGENLQDHAIIRVFMKIFNPPVVKRTDFNNDLFQYLQNRDGTLGTTAITNFLSFINTRNETDYPNIEYHHELFLKNDRFIFPDILHAFSFSDNAIERILKVNEQYEYLTLVGTVLNPKSKGKVQLRSANPFDPPLILPNFFDHEEDLQTALEAVKFIEKIAKTRAFKSYQLEILDLELDNCTKFEFRTDDYWKCYILNLATHIFHQSGTCKMGNRNDPTAVVNSKLQVHGIHNLRVADSSIMPRITSGNTNAPTIMIGEKASQMIKQFWLNKCDEL